MFYAGSGTMASTMARTADPEVRLRLIEEAAALVATGGPESLSVRRVAEAVGTSTMAVYTHFGSRDDLLRGVVERGFDLLAAALDAVPRTDDPGADAVALGFAYRSMALANANLYRVMFSVNPLALTDPGAEVGNGSDAGLRAFGAIADATRRCVDAGLFVGEPLQVARGLWGLVHGCVSLELAGLLEDGEQVLTALVANLAPR